jgi:hypothetical protein
MRGIRLCAPVHLLIEAPIDQILDELERSQEWMPAAASRITLAGFELDQNKSISQPREELTL